MASDVFGEQSIFHPALNSPGQIENLITVLRRIQRHVMENRLRVDEFFKVLSHHKLESLHSWLRV